MPPEAAQPARPLVLRERRDGSLHIVNAEWPHEHEFSFDGLMALMSKGHVRVNEAGEIVFEIANGWAVYQPDGRRSNGVWATLARGQVTGPVDPPAPPTPDGGS